jgi:hypothetical protein
VPFAVRGGEVTGADPGRLRGFERMADWIEHLCTAADQPELFPEVSADGGPFTRWQACKLTHGRAGRSRRQAARYLGGPSNYLYFSEQHTPLSLVPSPI